MAAVTGIKTDFKLDFTSPTQEELCDCIRAFLDRNFTLDPTCSQ